MMMSYFTDKPSWNGSYLFIGFTVNAFNVVNIDLETGHNNHFATPANANTLNLKFSRDFTIMEKVSLALAVEKCWVSTKELNPYNELLATIGISYNF